MDRVKIWRMYPNGQIKDESHVLWPHTADGQKCTGYNGDVKAWSDHNKEYRWGCAQIVQTNDDAPTVLYQGNVDAALTDSFVEKISNGESK